MRQQKKNRLGVTLLVTASFLAGAGASLTYVFANPVKVACILVQPGIFQRQ